MGKHKKRSRSETSSSSSEAPSDDDSGRKKTRKSHHKKESEEERKARKQQRKLEKQMMKKELKEQEEAQMAMHFAANMGYSNADNPWGDQNLNQKFVWVKKREIEVKRGITASERSVRDARRREEVETEVEKLKKRRAEREIEMQLREEEQIRLQREMDSAALGDWEERESDFHLQQAKKRAQIRIKEGRAKPIDILAMSVSLWTDSSVAEEFDALGMDFDFEEPYTIFRNLSSSEIEELHRDIKMYLSLEKDEINRQFWEAMLVTCENELSKIRSGSNHHGVHESVSAEVDKLLSKKTYEQLEIMFQQAKERLRGPGPVDVDFWESQLKAIIVWKAKAKLRDLHEKMLRKRYEQLKHLKVHDAVNKDISRSSKRENIPKEQLPVEEEASVELKVGYNSRMSPVPFMSLPKDDGVLVVIGEDLDFSSLSEMRKRVVEKYGARLQPTVVLHDEGLYSAADDELYAREAAKPMEEDEEVFGDLVIESVPAQGKEIVIPTTKSNQGMHTDKYRPRKPRYLNRVQTGYEWNKYNQTHYDSDNPPPKVVQGYKFNVFYPDLIDKTVAPTYHRMKDAGSEDTEIILFKAGPPYEDIAFRIVKREWELSHKKGFRNAYDRGVLQLHFHFKRHYYRR
ncbi:mid region of cactin-domain-containing protein [Cladochytrium replicatum]|nr:mid region of cactin-domain-containing protein [Cladochytrium replicatum]